MVLNGHDHTHEVIPITVELPFGTDAPSVARQFLATHAVSLPESLHEDAKLLVTEIVSNAVRHGAPFVTMQIRNDPFGVAVLISDEGPDLPQLPERRPDLEATSGRGMLIVDAVASRWGVTPKPANDGKTVWFELASPPS